MKIVVDENILGATAAFQQFGEVQLCQGRTLRSETLGDAEVLIVRSVTPVNADLLKGSQVKFVGSCTIGTDHMDLDYLQEHGIAYCNAPGSNADSVVDYVLSAMVSLPGLLTRLLNGERAGIIGLGNVGGRVAARLRALGIACDGYDPFVNPEQYDFLQNLDTLQRCHVICMHTPLTISGPYPSRHMLSLQWLQALPQGATLINAGRGAALDTDVLLALKQQRNDINLVLDVWEGEPSVNRQLAEQCVFATPHIAGYSADGKINGVGQVAKVLADFLGRPVMDFTLPADMLETPKIELGQGCQEDQIRHAVRAIYDIRDDDRCFRQTLKSDNPAAGFDLLRKNYPLRRELKTASLVDKQTRNASDTHLFAALSGQSLAGGIGI